MKRFLVYAPCEDYANDPAFRIRLLALQKRMARRGFTWEIRARPKMPWGRLALAWSARGYDGVILHKKMLDPLEARVLRMRSARSCRADLLTRSGRQPVGGVVRRVTAVCDRRR